MTATPDAPEIDTPEIDQARAFAREHGLLPQIPSTMLLHGADRDDEFRTVLARARTAASVTPTHESSATHSPRPHRRWSSRTLYSLAASLLVFTVIVVWMIGGGAPAAMATPPSLTYSTADPAQLNQAPVAAGVLADLADTARKHAPSQSTPSDAASVQFVSTTGWLLSIHQEADGHAFAEVSSTVTRRWLAPDGSALAEQNRGPNLDLDGHILDVSHGPDLDDAVQSDALPPGTIDAMFVANLPATPDALRETILNLNAAPSTLPPVEQAWLMADEVPSLFSTYVVPGRVAATLWDVLADMPSVRDLGTTTDRFGRTTAAIAVPSPPSETAQRVLVLLISPTTGLLQGTEEITLRNDKLSITTPTVTGFQTWTDARYVTAIGSTDPR
ncbi:MAG: CU044_5270 family protein [Cellulomonadaceae bacterium]|jgi:hypothetical protein|nr:CU044_5270 family protein [Cellulomonadaceae bacterium]